MSEKYPILIADDNEPTRNLLAAFLEKEGYPILHAADGAEAFKIAETQKLSCAIIDQYMEPKGGFDFAINAEAFNVKVPMILITAHETSDLLMKARKHGFAQVLTKPVDPERLIIMVNKLARLVR